MGGERRTVAVRVWLDGVWGVGMCRGVLSGCWDVPGVALGDTAYFEKMNIFFE